MRPLTVLFAASECAPLAKVGGLGDVLGSLPEALRSRGLETAVIIPFYETIDRLRFKPQRCFALDDETSLYVALLPGRRARIFLVQNKALLGTGPVYFERSAFAASLKEIKRFTFFSRAVFRLLHDPRMASYFSPQVVHCNDWHTGALVAALSRHVPRRGESAPRTVFTIHNLANQGAWKGENLMRKGILNADMVTTVSPSYAKEILTERYGEGLTRPLRARANEGKLIGILNGIDTRVWPLERRDKTAFQKELGLTKSAVPLFGLVSRLTHQKGIDFAVTAAPELIERCGAQFAVLGVGERIYEDALVSLAKRYPKQVAVTIGFDEKRARRIYAQSDFFLMPSRFEPSGLGQMISMRYGTIPVARATGGLKDSVRHRKTGFLFLRASSAALAQAMRLATETFSRPKELSRMRKNCRQEDFRWEKSAERYRALYRRLRCF